MQCFLAPQVSREWIRCERLCEWVCKVPIAGRTIVNGSVTPKQSGLVWCSDESSYECPQLDWGIGGESSTNPKGLTFQGEATSFWGSSEASKFRRYSRAKSGDLSPRVVVVVVVQAEGRSNSDSSFGCRVVGVGPLPSWNWNEWYFVLLYVIV